MRGNNRQAANAPKVLGNRHGQGRAFFGISGRTQFIQQNQRPSGRGARDEVNVGHMRGKSREILLD